MENIKINKVNIGDISDNIIEFYKDYLSNVRSFKRLNKSARKRKIDNFVCGLLKRSLILVACDKENDSLVYSYVFFYRKNNKLTVNFAYTNPIFRNYGIIKSILKKLEQDCHTLMHTIPTSKLALFSVWKRYKLRKYNL